MIFFLRSVLSLRLSVARPLASNASGRAMLQARIRTWVGFARSHSLVELQGLPAYLPLPGMARLPQP